MKASYNQQPQALELMPDGYHLFRFDIEQVTNGEQTQWQCREVAIYGAVTSNKITEAAIAEKWGGGVENKLINDYNEYKAGFGVVESEAKYLQFLEARKVLKQYILAVCTN
jgi:hypothetical protein